MTSTLHIALADNPNSGKSSLFNALTGLHQHVGSFPGVTEDKKFGKAVFSEKVTASVVDLPGSYSLYPKRDDEWVSFQILLNNDKRYPCDCVVADAGNLRGNLLFCSQIIDLKRPAVITLSMMDIAAKNEFRYS